MRNAFAAVLLSGILVASGAAVAQNKDETGLEHLVIEMATTSGQHHALAEHYTAKAEAARQEMRHHQSMASAYMRGKTAQPQLRDHCQRIAKNYEQIAAEYDDLAKQHEQEATHAPK